MIETTDIEKRVVRKNELPAPLIPLERLAWNYWWSWAADGASVFRDLDPDGPGEDVPDPYYGAAAGFDDVLDIVTRTALVLLEELRPRPPA